MRRQWPQDVYVRFTEQKLAARWGTDAFLNQVGDVVRVGGNDLPAGLPQLDGPDGTGPQVIEHYTGFGRILAAAGLKLERITLTPRRSWRLVLAGGMVIVVDREQPEQKLERFARVYVKALMPLASDIKQVDLRYTNGFALQETGGRSASRRVAPAHVGRTGSGRMGAVDKG